MNQGLSHPLDKLINDNSLIMLEAMVPFVDFKMNREELADFLSVTRPSLSRSLMKMQREGLIWVHKSKARILNLDGLEKVCHK